VRSAASTARVVVGVVVMTIGVTADADGGWKMLGLDVGDSKDGAFWTALVCGLRAQGAGRRQAGALRRPPSRIGAFAN
jgi:transposase-like protein